MDRSGFFKQGDPCGRRYHGRRRLVLRHRFIPLPQGRLPEMDADERCGCHRLCAGNPVFPQRWDDLSKGLHVSISGGYRRIMDKASRQEGQDKEQPANGGDAGRSGQLYRREASESDPEKAGYVPLQHPHADERLRRPLFTYKARVKSTEVRQRAQKDSPQMAQLSLSLSVLGLTKNLFNFIC